MPHVSNHSRRRCHPSLPVCYTTTAILNQGIKAEFELEDSALEGYYASAKFNSDCGDYGNAGVALKNYCDITQTPGVPGSGPNGMSALWGRLACEVRATMSVLFYVERVHGRNPR